MSLTYVIFELGVISAISKQVFTFFYFADYFVFQNFTFLFGLVFYMSKDKKGQQVMEHNWFSLEFLVPHGKDTF